MAFNWDQFQQAPTTGGITGQPYVDPGQLQQQPDPTFGFTDPGYANRPPIDPNNLPMAPDWQSRMLLPGTEPDVVQGGQLPLMQGTKNPDGGFTIPGVGTVGADGQWTPDLTARHYQGLGLGGSLATLGAGASPKRGSGLFGSLGSALSQLGRPSGGGMMGALAQIMTPSGKRMGIPQEQLQEAIRRGARPIGGGQ